MDDIELNNACSALLYRLGKETPAKTWWNATAQHPAIARALRVSREDPAHVFALAPFRLHRDEDGNHVILIAYPTPRILGPIDPDWLDVEDVLAWNPVDGSFRILGQTEAMLFGDLNDDRSSLFGDIFAFLRAWVEARAAFFTLWCSHRKGTWRHGATETDMVPGAMIVGDAAKIHWKPATMPQNLTCVGCDARSINQHLVKAAHVPWAIQGAQESKAA